MAAGVDPVHLAVMSLREEAKKTFDYYDLQLRQHELAAGNRALCPATLQEHALVTFHSEGRAECIDCHRQFGLDDPFLTTHRRSSTL